MQRLLACVRERDNWPEEFISALEACGHTAIAAEMTQEYDSLRAQGSKQILVFVWRFGLLCTFFFSAVIGLSFLLKVNALRHRLFCNLLFKASLKSQH